MYILLFYNNRVPSIHSRACCNILPGYVSGGYGLLKQGIFDAIGHKIGLDQEMTFRILPSALVHVENVTNSVSSPLLLPDSSDSSEGEIHNLKTFCGVNSKHWLVIQLMALESHYISRRYREQLWDAHVSLFQQLEPSVKHFRKFTKNVLQNPLIDHGIGVELVSK